MALKGVVCKGRAGAKVWGTTELGARASWQKWWQMRTNPRQKGGFFRILKKEIAVQRNRKDVEPGSNLNDHSWALLQTVRPWTVM